MNATLIKNWALAALAVAAVSCAKEQTSPNVDDGQEVNVAFNIAAPSALVTKGINDGTTAKNLTVAVYDDNNGSADKHIAALDKSATFEKLKARVEFSLVKGKTYHFIFWAQSGTEAYKLLPEEKSVEIHYDGVANDESRDAFFATKSLKVTGALNETVELHRPFAQVNFGTADLEAAAKNGFVPTKSTFSLSANGAASLLKPFERVAEGGVCVNYTEAAIPTEKLVLNDEKESEYDWLAMNYFIPKGKLDEQQVCDFKATFVTDANEAVEISVPAAPVQANYRTNIVGNLLTDQVIFNVVIDPNFDGNETIAFWDGSIEEVTQTADGVYEISNGSQLAWVAQQVNAGTETFSGKTVKLVKNIYLANTAWTPIGRMVAAPGQCFQGTFDGNGKTIYDLNASDYIVVHSSAGLFGGVAENATVKDVTVENATVKSNHYAGVICGWLQDAKIQNCMVSNATVTSSPEFVPETYSDKNEWGWNNGDKVGGIVGYICRSEVTGCSVENATIKAYRDLGGVVGYANNSSVVTDNTISNVTITVDNSHNYKEYTEQSQYDANSIVGENGGGTTSTIESNEGTATIIFPTVATTQEELDNAITGGGE